MKKIELERRLAGRKKSFHLAGILLWCGLGVIILIAGDLLINYIKKASRTEKIGYILQDIRTDMQAHNYANAWASLQKAKAIDPFDEGAVKLTAALLKEPLEMANSLIDQGQFEEVRKILADVKTFDAAAETTPLFKRCDYEQYLALARKESADLLQVNKYGGLHCWKEAAKAYEKAIAVSDTSDARQGLKTAVEMLKVEEDALLTRLHNEANSAIQSCNTNTMSQHVVNISALKGSLSQGDKVDEILEELKNGLANVEKIASLEEALNKAKLEGRNEDAIGNIADILKLLPVQSTKYAQYTSELKKLSNGSIHLPKEQAETKEQAEAIETKKCIWRITPSSSEGISEDGVIRFKVISVAPGYDAIKNIGNLCANMRAPNRQNSTRLGSEKDYLETVLNNNRELVTAEVDVRNAGKISVPFDKASFKFVDQNDNNYDCANLIDIGANSNNLVTLEATLKKKLYALFVVPHDIMPKGIRLLVTVNVNRRDFRNAVKKSDLFSAFEKVEVNGRLIAGKEARPKNSAVDNLISSLVKNDRVFINLEGLDSAKTYIGKILQISQTHIMLEQEGESICVISVPIDNIASIKKLEKKENN